MLKRQVLCCMAIVCLLLGLGSPSPSWADHAVKKEDTTCDTRIWGGDCTVRADPPQNPSPPPGHRGHPGRKVVCEYEGSPIACHTEAGVWSNERDCWVKRASEQPPKSDPIWNGRDEGAIYWCTPPYHRGLGGHPYPFWAPTPPVAVDPVDLAEEAIERMHLANPEVGLTPLDPDALMIVGVPVWLWLADHGPHSYGPITRTATAGSTSVTATAYVTEVTWDLGDGTSMTCADAGTPWTPARGTGPSPSCGHTYEKPSINEPDDTYDITATTHWQVDWSGAGQSGQITFSLSGTRELEVSEVQVLQTR